MGGYAPPPMSGRRARNISDLIRRQGDVAAQGAARSGEIWGRAFSDAGRSVEEWLDRRQEKKALSRQSEALGGFLSNLPEDPQEVLMGSVKILGPDRGVKFAQGVMAVRGIQEAPNPQEAIKNLPYVARGFLSTPDDLKPTIYSGVRGLLVNAGIADEAGLPEQFSPDLIPMIEGFAAKAEKPEGQVVETVGPEGQPIKRFVGQEELTQGVPMPSKPQASPGVGSFEDYLVKRFGPQPTPQQITQARQTYETSGRKPEQPIGETGTTLAQGIANYGIRPSAYLLRSREGQQIMGEVMRLNPTYDQTKYDARNKLRADFTSGKTGNNIDALNTAVDHLSTLKDLSSGLAQSDVQMVNAAVNKIRTSLGDPGVTNFKTAATAVESEVASLLKKTGATDQEINAWRANFGADMSPRQLQGAVNTALKIMRGRERALQHRWQVGMAVDRDYPIYGDEQMQILDALGYNAGLGGTDEESRGWQTVTVNGQTVRIRKKQ